jgi:hypothetical protein
MKRSFLYSAVTLFDTSNTSNDSTSFGGAGSVVIFGLVFFACGGLRFDSPGVSLLFSGRGSAFQNNMVASNVTRLQLSEYPTSNRYDEHDGRINVIRINCTVAGVPRFGG